MDTQRVSNDRRHAVKLPGGSTVPSPPSAAKGSPSVQDANSSAVPLQAILIPARFSGLVTTQTGFYISAQRLRRSAVLRRYPGKSFGKIPQPLALAENLVSLALRDLKEDAERLDTTIAVLDFLVSTGQYERADSLLAPACKDTRTVSRPRAT